MRNLNRYMEEKELLMLDPESPPGSLFAINGLYQLIKTQDKKFEIKRIQCEEDKAFQH